MAASNRPALLFWLLASAAFADVAVSTVSDSSAYEKPDLTSGVIEAVPRRTEVLVFERPLHGFRQVTLPDGKTGFIPETAFGASDAPLALTPSRPRTYVQSVYHLAAITQSDHVVNEKAGALAARNSWALATLVGGGLIGVALAGVTVFSPPDSCTTTIYQPGATSCQLGAAQLALIGVGAVIVVASIVTYFLLRPSAREFHDAVVIWNTRHPQDALAPMP